jgi:hypothetical protein
MVAFSLSLALAENGKANATKTMNMTNTTKNMTNITKNMTNATDSRAKTEVYKKDQYLNSDHP